MRTVPSCVTCWVRLNELVDAAFIYDGVSLCLGHMIERRDINVTGVNGGRTDSGDDE